MSTEIVNVDEYEALAQRRMPKMAFDFFSSGSEDQVTLRENRAAFTRIRYAHIPTRSISDDYHALYRAVVDPIRLSSSQSGACPGCDLGF